MRPAQSLDRVAFHSCQLLGRKAAPGAGREAAHVKDVLDADRDSEKGPSLGGIRQSGDELGRLIAEAYESTGLRKEGRQYGLDAGEFDREPVDILSGRGLSLPESPSPRRKGRPFHRPDRNRLS